MKNSILIITLILTISSPCLYAQVEQSKLDSLVSHLAENFKKDNQTVGLSIGIYNKGKISFYNFGSIEKNKKNLPTPNTGYEIGSITKAFVSLVLAHAVLEKKVNLADDIRKYIDGSYPNLEYDGHPITLLNLANTTSGLPNWLPLTPPEITNAPADSQSVLRERIYGKYTADDFYKSLQYVKLDTVPGSKARHSNAAAQLLANILEKVYKTPIEDLIRKYILHPLKMKHTSFLASPHTLLAKGYDDKGNVMPYFTNHNMVGVGGINSSAADLIKFIKAQLNETNDAIRLSHQKTFITENYGIGLNWIIYQEKNESPQIFTDGGTYGFVSYILLYPSINSGIIFLSNENDDTVLGKFDEMADPISKFMGQK